MKILTPDQVRALDTRAMKDLGLPAALLMENAGRAIADAICKRVGAPNGRHVTVLAGAGNNGGDGFVAARVLQDRGFKAEVFLAGEIDKMTPETALHFHAMKKLGVDVRLVKEPPRGPELQNLRRSLGRSAAIVDALAGIGLQGELREPVRTLAAQLDGRYRALVVAADIPSGLSAQDGRVQGVAVVAQLCVTMAVAKPGLFLGDGPKYWQELEIAEIGVPAAWIAAAEPFGQTIDAALAKKLLPVRDDQGYKGRFGHLFLLAGSPGKAGAALLCGGAALRSGVGLCTLGTSGEIRGRLEASIPDLMVEAVRGGASEIKRIEKLLQKKSAVAVGPGLGTSAAEVDLVQRVLAMTDVPVVLDADALQILAGKREMAAPAAGRLVLTPHPGEMAALMATTVEAVEADRLGLAQKLASELQAVVVLKGARTLVVAPNGLWSLCPDANAALAKGGTGDVLTGLIGGLLAQGLALFDAAQLGVALHSLAGQRLRTQAGTRAGLASELLDVLPAAIAGLEA
jgi:hydroxyethylthiazole kinase-like uncharacterized protein yjeF